MLDQILDPMEKRWLLLLVFLLPFFHLINSSNAFSSASSISGVRKLLNGASGGQLPAPEDSMKMTMIDEATLELDVVNKRMNLESNDYPGSGANKRHTPKPPGRP